MDVRKYFSILLLLAIPATADEIRVASFHASQLSLQSDIAGVADRLQAYDFVAIQDLRDLAAVDELLATLFRRSDFFKILPSQPSGEDGARYAFAWRDRSIKIISPGSFLGNNPSRRPVYATFRAGNFDFVAVNYQSATTATVAADSLLQDAHTQLKEILPDEHDLLLFASFSHVAPELAALDPIFPLDNIVSINGDGVHANIYLSTVNTREHSGTSGIDDFDATAFNNDVEKAVRVSQQRPVWAIFSTDAPDDDGPDLTPPSPVLEQNWAHIKAARPIP